MKIKFELSSTEQFHAAYLRFSKNNISRTEKVDRFVNADYDKNGKLVGIEFLGTCEFDMDLKKELS